VEDEFPVDKEELMRMVKDNKVKPILSGEQEFWEAFKCLNYDLWYQVSLHPRPLNPKPLPLTP
jgi:hypothetical protein